MTEPRRKEWLFDEKKADRLLLGLAEGWEYPMDVKGYFQSEIQRNLKEFADTVKKTCGTDGFIDIKIDDALKERGIE